MRIGGSHGIRPGTVHLCVNDEGRAIHVKAPLHDVAVMIAADQVEQCVLAAEAIGAIGAIGAAADHPRAAACGTMPD